MNRLLNRLKGILFGKKLSFEESSNIILNHINSHIEIMKNEVVEPDFHLKHIERQLEILNKKVIK